MSKLRPSLSAKATTVAALSTQSWRSPAGGIALAEAPVQLIETAAAKVADGQSHGGALRLIARGLGFKFE